MSATGARVGVARLLTAAVLVLTLGADRQEGARQTKEKHADPIMQLLPRDAIPALRDPRFILAEKASLQPTEKVLGVIIGNEKRAYPLIDLDRHEVVDDMVGGRPIAATW